MELPAEAKRYCHRGKTAFALSNTAESFLFQASGGRPGYWRVLKYHLAFAGTWPERTLLVLMRLFAPAESDWQHLRLPRSLFLLYYLLRPLRFFQQQVSRFIRAFGE
jgi:hypothetical protein